jgi:hypothetical protein
MRVGAPRVRKDVQQAGWIKRCLSSVFASWREYHHVARSSNELLALYQTAAADHPDLSDRDHYRLIVMQRTGFNSTAASLILDHAEESYAAWPAPRMLTLCDVIRYVAVRELLAMGDRGDGIHSDIQNIIAARIPHPLCARRHSD